jgi:hypothetical protein
LAFSTSYISSVGSKYNSTLSRMKISHPNRPSGIGIEPRRTAPPVIKAKHRHHSAIRKQCWTKNQRGVRTLHSQFLREEEMMWWKPPTMNPANRDLVGHPASSSSTREKMLFLLLVVMHFHRLTVFIFIGLDY